MSRAYGTQLLGLVIFNGLKPVAIILVVPTALCFSLNPPEICNTETYYFFYNPKRGVAATHIAATDFNPL
jgi:hypothetical protein